MMSFVAIRQRHPQRGCSVRVCVCVWVYVCVSPTSQPTFPAPFSWPCSFGEAATNDAPHVNRWLNLKMHSEKGIFII